MSEIKKLTIGQDELDLSKYTPNDATLTIQHNGTTVDTFTANSSTNKTVNIETIHSEDVSSTQPIAQVVSTAMIQDEAVTADKISLPTLVKSGVWTTTVSLPSTASSTNTVIDISSLGFSSADEYAVLAQNIGGGNNYPFALITVDSKNAANFTLKVWNAHWASGSIGAGINVQWFVFKIA